MKNRIIYILLELVGGILFGFSGFYFSSKFFPDSSFTWGIPQFIIALIPLSIIGIAIPGYFQCKAYKDLQSFKMAIISSLFWLIISILILTVINVTTVTIDLRFIVLLSIIVSVSGFNLQTFDNRQPAANTR